MRTRWYVGMMMCVFGISACGKDPEVVNNSRNNTLPDMDIPDAPLDMPDDMLPIPFNCTTLGFAPYTIPADQGASVAVDFGCTGGSGDLETEIAYELTYPDGSITRGTVMTTLTQGTFTVDIEVPPRDFIAGPIDVQFFRKSESERPNNKSDASWFEWDLGERERPSMRLHQPNSQISAYWSDRAGFSPVPPNPDAKLVRLTMGDFSGAGRLDVLTIWRYGTKLGLQTYNGATFEAGQVQEIEVGPINEACQETVRVARAKGSTSAIAQAVIFMKGPSWNAIDGTCQEQSDGRVQMLTIGTTGTTSFSFDGTSHAKVESILGVEIVDTPDLAEGAAPEVLIFYRGTTGGVKPVFATLQTHTASQKLIQTSVMDTLDGIVPAKVAAGDVQVGLMRGVSGVADKRFMYKAENLFAWTFGPTGPMGEHEFKRVQINAPQAGTLSAKVLVDVQPGESGFAAEAVDLDGNQTNDLVLSSVDKDLAPVIRTWKLDGEGNIGTASRLLPAHTQVRVESTGHFIDDWQGESMYVSSVSHPHALRTAKIAGSTSTHVVSATFNTTVGTGDSVPVELAWEPGNPNVVYMQPITLSSKSDYASFDSNIHSLASSYDGKNVLISVRKTNDKALIASHESGLSVFLESTGMIGVTGPKTAGGRFDLQPNGQIVGIVTNRAQDKTLVLDRAKGDSNWNFHVWSVTAAGIEGPGVLTVPASLGDFLPSSPMSDEVLFGSTENGEFKTFVLSLEDLAGLAKNKETRAISEASIKKLAGESVEVPQALLRRKIQASNASAMERARKAAEKQKFELGVMPPTRGVETMAVVGRASDTCPLQTVFFAGETSEPVVISESNQQDCWDLHVPVMVADICGVGGLQLVTAAADTTARASWTWEFLLWTRDTQSIVATSLGTVQMPPQVRPLVTASDVNGDGVVDLIVRVENPQMAPGEWSDVVLFGDGLAGGLQSSGEVPNFTSEVRTIPGAGLGQGGGQVACGVGLQCNLGTGTRTTYGQASTKAELL